MNCYKCNSTETVKNGTDNKGRQKFLCKCCHSILTTNARPVFSKEEKTIISKMLKNGEDPKTIASLFNRTHKAILNLRLRLNS